VRSRAARVRTRVSVLMTGLVCALLASLAAAGSAAADTVVEASADDTPMESLMTPVGLAAVGFGVVGMIAGVFRRKKTPVHPENQRKVL
jgi:hypothetical protein